MKQPMSIYWPMAMTGVRVQTRLAGITKAANMALIGIGGKGVAV